MDKVIQGPSRSAVPQRTSISLLGFVGTQCVLRLVVCYWNTRIQESRDLGQGSNLEMGTVGRDPELKLLRLESSLVCQVVGMQVCWVVSQVTLPCCLDTSCQLFSCVLFSHRGHLWDWREMQTPCWKVILQLSQTPFVPQTKRYRSPTSTLGKAHIGWCKGDTSNICLCYPKSRLRSMWCLCLAMTHLELHYS